MDAIVVKFRCAGCGLLHAARAMLVTAAGRRCSRCVPLTGRDQVQARRRREEGRRTWRRSAA